MAVTGDGSRPFLCLAYTRAKLAIELKGLFVEKAKDNQRESGGAVPQKSVKPPIDTQKELAKIAGVSHDTISKVERIERDVIM